MTWLASNWIWALLIGGGLLYLLSRRSGHGGHGGLRRHGIGLGHGSPRSNGRHRRDGC